MGKVFAGGLLLVLGCSLDQSPTQPDLTAANTVAVGSIVLTPQTAVITVSRGSLQIGATLRGPKGKLLPPGSVPIQWTSLNPKKVLVDSNGKVTAVGSSGIARVTAKAGTKLDTTVVTLSVARPCPLHSTLVVSSPVLAVGAAVESVTVIARDSVGRILPNVPVTVSISGSGNTVTQSAPTDSNGQAVAVFSSVRAEMKAVTAVVGTLALDTVYVRAFNTELISAVPSCVLPTSPMPGTVNLATDLTYTTVAGVPIQLDIAWPKTPGLHPFLLLIHGGGWFRGDKTKYRNEILTLAGMGYTAVSVNYRLATATTNTAPAAVQDVRCALRWIRAQAARYFLDPNRGAAIGSSAGAHLASMLGTTADVAGLDGNCPVTDSMATLKTVVGFSGPSDLRSSSLFISGGSQQAVTQFLGGVPETVPAVASLVSPVVHASSVDVPALFVHGTADSTVPYRHSPDMKAALNRVGVSATVILLPGQPHSLGLFNGTAGALPGTCTMLDLLRREVAP